MRGLAGGLPARPGAGRPDCPASADGGESSAGVLAALLRGGAWKPEQWLPAHAQPSAAEVTLAQLRMPALTIADIEKVEADSLKYRYE
ncbi:hypothetical protein [Plantactinospora soyae]|uniref:Uncharacterized protein n=1 Tax=Plantactinospora soyae TaxID=1544732 RepID=A0A927QZH1_9ACTN|nr:hypothetical protein [Plantactinospora soyae]MBE1490395.1 hypothetical protein [Plantactinospora soyae]